VRVTAVLFLLLSVFVLLAGATLGLWGHAVAGTFYLTVLGVAFAYLYSVLRSAGVDEPSVLAGEAWTGVGARTEPAEHGEPSPADPPVAKAMSFHASAPSITPFLLALATGLVVTGLVFSQWLVITGAGVLALVMIVWFVETGHRRAAEEAAKAGHGGHH
jgi:hypothetical protein